MTETNSEWKDIDGKKLESLIIGKRIVKAEPVDYPVTDEVLLWLEDDHGEVSVLAIGADPYDPDFIFYIQMGDPASLD